MMSTAILLKAGAEPPVVNLASTGRDAPTGISFAESLSESVGDTKLSGGKASAGETAKALSNSKSAEVAKRSDEFAEGRAAAGERVAVDHPGSEPTGLKKSVAEKVLEPRVTTVMVSQSKALSGNPGSKETESPVQAEMGDLSPGRDDPQTGELKDREPVSVVDVGKDDSAVIGNCSPAVVTKEQMTEPAEKAIEMASGRKAARSSESGIAPKNAPKNSTLVESESTIRPKLDATNPTEGGGEISAGMATAPFALPRYEGGAATKITSEVSDAVIPSTAPTFAPSAGSVRSEAAQGVKDGMKDIETAGDASTASPKSSVGPEATVTSSSVSSDSDGKVQIASVSLPVFAHAMSGDAEASSGSNPLVPVHGGVQGNLASAQSQVGNAVPHSSGLSNGMREQEGLVASGASMGEVPRMLASTPTMLEVGVQNGMHGWLKIRAEMTDGGVVNASVSTASATEQEMLHRELPALTAYLAEEKVAVNAVVVHAPSASGTDARSSSGMAGAGGESSQRSNDGEERAQSFGKATVSDSSNAMTYQGMQGVDQDGALPLSGYGSGGGWLSVRA